MKKIEFDFIYDLHLFLAKNKNIKIMKIKYDYRTNRKNKFIILFIDAINHYTNRYKLFLRIKK